jgi:hypothetical protein
MGGTLASTPEGLHSIHDLISPQGRPIWSQGMLVPAVTDGGWRAPE